MRVLILCECSGVIRRAFRAAGHDAWSCDLQPADDGDPHHYQMDARELLEYPGCKPETWDLIICHPECKYLCNSGWHWTVRDLTGERMKKAEAARDFFTWCYRLYDRGAKRVAVENPRGKMSTWLRPPDQEVQPYFFGDDASKLTGLWLRNLPPLKETCRVAPRWVDGKPRWGNQTDSGNNRVPGTKRQSKLRSETFPGLADAMVKQWGVLDAL